MTATVRMRVVGTGRVHRRGAVERLMPEAVELAGRGYTVAFSCSENTNVVLELSAAPGQDRVSVVVRPPSTREGNYPWMAAARRLAKETPIMRRSTVT